MADVLKKTEAADALQTKEKTGQDMQAISENWAEETIADLDDFIESQGIYIRQ